MSEEQDSLLYKAAVVWKELTEYHYVFTYGYKQKLYTINLTFSPEDFPHLAGFQYLKDISLPRYAPPKILKKILDKTIKTQSIEKGAQYSDMVVPRLDALIRLKDIMDNEFSLYSFMPQFYSFTTNIKADYLIASNRDFIDYIFIIESLPDGSAKCDFVCNSAFTKGNRDYEENQSSRTLLKKERIYLPDNSSYIFFDKIKK